MFEPRNGNLAPLNFGLELAAVGRMATAELHAQQLPIALVQFVVADRRGGQADVVEKFDGWFVVEERRSQRRRPDVVAGADHKCIRSGRLELFDPGSDVGGTAGFHFCSVVQGHHSRRARGRLQIAVEVVHGDDPYRDRGMHPGVDGVSASADGAKTLAATNPVVRAIASLRSVRVAFKSPVLQVVVVEKPCQATVRPLW